MYILHLKIMYLFPYTYLIGLYLRIYFLQQYSFLDKTLIYQVLQSLLYVKLLYFQRHTVLFRGELFSSEHETEIFNTRILGSNGWGVREKDTAFRHWKMEVKNAIQK